MAEDSFQEKTEKATPRKRQKAREKGQAAKSVEITSVIVLLTGSVAMYIFGHYFYSNLLGIMRSSFTFNTVLDFDLSYCISFIGKVTIKFVFIILPLLGALFLAALAANFMQVGFLFSFGPIEPKLSKLSFIKGLKKLFSLRSFVELIKSILKLIIIGLVAYFVIAGQINHALTLQSADVAHIFVFILKVFFKIFIWVLLIMGALAALDYAFQKWLSEKDLKMTKQEVKEEAKQTEGDPQLKSKIRNIQYQTAKKRMMKEIPKADVVITNPTHLALALKYDPISMKAPKVVAKGAGSIAERIKKMAAMHNIPVVENRKLAQNLYKVVDVGEEIPSDMYKAVAELLAYIFKLKGKSI